MKKLILSCLSVFLLSGAAKAQLSYGPELGFNLSDYHIDFPGFLTPATVPVPGAHVGGVVNYRFSDHLALEPGAFFAINGIKYTYDLFFLGSISATAHLNTIQIPVNVIYTFGEPGSNRFFISAGPYVGLNLGGSVKVNGSITGLDSLLGSSVSSIDTSVKITSGNGPSDYIKKFDFGIGVNLGYQFTNGLFIRASYAHGLLNLAPADGYETSSIKSVNYSLSVGYLFGSKQGKKTKDAANGKKR